jgi:hypothetical protein
MIGPVLLATLFAAEAPVYVHGRSRTSIVVGRRAGFVEGASPRLEAMSMIPILQEVTLDAAPGIDGVTIALDAWLALDAGDRMLAERALADVTEGWIRYEKRRFALRAGRLMLSTLAGRAERIDGAIVHYRPLLFDGAAALEVEAFSGLPVTPRYGDEALLDPRGPAATRDPLVLALAGTDWKRPGDWIAGASIGVRAEGIFSAGAGYVRKHDLSEIAREAVVASIGVDPWRFFGASASGSFDLYAGALEQGRIDVHSWPIEQVRLGAYAQRISPALLLPSTSLFTVFGTDTHQDLGFEADLFLGGLLRLGGIAELRRTEAEGGEVGRGHRLALVLRAPLPLWTEARTTLGFERLFDDWHGSYDYARAGVEAPLARWLALSADGGVFRLSSGGWAKRGGVAGTFAIGEARAAIALQGTDAPGLWSDVTLIGRIEWNAEHTF